MNLNFESNILFRWLSNQFIQFFLQVLQHYLAQFWGIFNQMV